MLLLWLATFGVAICWIFWKDAPFDPESITVVLGLFSTAGLRLSSVSSLSDWRKKNSPYHMRWQANLSNPGKYCIFPHAAGFFSSADLFS
jgi:hypothetical protein